MIEVTTQVRHIDTSDGNRVYEAVISAAGHAGYDVEGRDIVCASVSTAMECIEQLLEYNLPAVGSDGESGSISIWIPAPSLQTALRSLDLIEPILQVIEDLSREYPDNVSVTRFTSASAV